MGGKIKKEKSKRGKRENEEVKRGQKEGKRRKPEKSCGIKMG